MTDLGDLPEPLAVVARDGVWLRTEPHSPDRLWWLGATPIIDLHDLRPASSFRERRRAFATATARVRAVLDTRPVPAMAFDTTEGWLSTSMSIWLENTFPGVARVGLQHGLMPITGRASATPVRRLRRATSRLAVRRLGVAPIGGGFGNIAFDHVVVMGQRYGDYIRRVNPHTDLTIDLGYISDIGRIRQHRKPANTEAIDQVLFYDQHFAGLDSGPVVRHLAEIADKNGLRFAYRAHPKAPGTPVGGHVTTAGPLSEELANPGVSLVCSYYSTCLLEAHWMGAPILSIRHPAASLASYGAFDGIISLAEAMLVQDFNDRTTVRDGYT